MSKFFNTIKMIVIIFYLNMITTTKFRVNEEEKNELIIKGEINSKTFKQLKKVLSENPQIDTLLLLDCPGSLNDEVNIPMCHFVREKGLNTKVTKESHTASGGTDLFLAGVKRYYQEGARIGVHSWQDSSGKEAKDIPKEDKSHKMFTEYTNKMLGSDDFYWFTIYAAPARGMYYMTQEELEKFQVITDFA